jgi:hypothetical protein
LTTLISPGTYQEARAEMGIERLLFPSFIRSLLHPLNTLVCACVRLANRPDLLGLHDGDGGDDVDDDDLSDE